LLDGNYFSVLGVFVSRAAFDAVKFHEDRRLPPSEDWLCWLRLAARHEPVCSLTVTAHAIDHPTRSMAGNLLAKSESVERVEQYALKDEVFVEKHRKRLKRFRAYVAMYSGMCLAQSKKARQKALRRLSRAAVLYPPVLARKTFWAAVKHWF
jgi:hypothetical protein